MVVAGVGLSLTGRVADAEVDTEDLLKLTTPVEDGVAGIEPRVLSAVVDDVDVGGFDIELYSYDSCEIQ